MKPSADKSPLVLLDFDDVLNIPLNKPIKKNSRYKWRTKSGWDFHSWSSEVFHDEEKDTEYVITTSTDMLSALLSLEDDGLCQLVWLSTWTQHDGSLNTLLTRDNIADLAETSHSWGHTSRRQGFLTDLIGRDLPSAGGKGAQNPHYIGRRIIDNWWKWDAVQRLRAEGHPVVFADDLLNDFRGIYKNEQREDAQLLKLMRINAHMGLTRSNYAEIKGFLKSL